MIDYKFHFYDSVDSTNSQIKRLDHQGKPEGSIAVAKTQTAGRGRWGRRWVSPVGNIYFSLLLKPKVTLEILSQLSLVTGVALAQTLHEYIQDKAKIALKWPNDILLNGQKAAGILIETDMDRGVEENLACYLGVGINMVSSPELTAYPATSFKDFSDCFPVALEIINLFLSKFSKVYERWNEKGFKDIKEDWLLFAHGIGETAIANAAREGQISGIFQTITDEGGLVLMDGTGHSHIISSCEVTFSDIRNSAQ